MTPDLLGIPGPWPGKLAVATRPRGGDWLDDEARGWRRAGVDVVVSLLEGDEAAQLELDRERGAAESNSIRFISFPIPDRGIPASLPNALHSLKEIRDALEKGGNVAVHCRQGVGRSGMIAIGVLMNSGASPENAIHTVSAARGEAVPETPAQLSWIRRLPSAQLVPAS